VLIDTTGHPLAEIGAATGFATQSHSHRAVD
jgi:transcriptional regulator GlxA family with amidase domain